MKDLLLSPPLALSILIVFAVVYYAFLRTMTLKNVPPTEGLTKPYACGEEQTENLQADYGAFFPFAFFFTILHVVALTVTTVPVETMGSVIIAVLYIGGALLGLSVLYRSYG